jgi:hypothetical protein
LPTSSPSWVGGRAEGVERGPGELGKLAQSIGVLGGEVGAAGVVGQLQEAVAAAVLSEDGRGQPAPHRGVVRGLTAEGMPGGMGFDLGLGQPHHLARGQVQAVQPEFPRIHADARAALVRFLDHPSRGAQACLSRTR